MGYHEMLWGLDAFEDVFYQTAYYSKSSYFRGREARKEKENGKELQSIMRNLCAR